jgi:hypothetical protein
MDEESLEEEIIEDLIPFIISIITTTSNSEGKRPL